MTENSLSQAFQHWEQTIETLSTRLEKLEQQVAQLDQLEQRIAALEQRLFPPNPQPTTSALSSHAASAARNLSVDTKLRLGLPPPVRARIARWLGEHGMNEQTARNWEDLPLDDLQAALLYAKQRAAAASKTRSPNRVLYRCENPHCPCQDMSLPGPLPIRSSPADASDDGMPPPVRRYIARWLAQHGANPNTVVSVGWRLMPLTPREALIFARDRIAAASGGGARARGVQLRPCTNARCVCHEVLAE